MATEHEFEGKTKEEAMAKACEALGLPEEQLKVEVVSYGSTGIFGLVGVKKARIKVILPETAAPPEPVKTEEVAEAPAELEDGEDVGEIARQIVTEIVSFIVDDPVVSVQKKAGAVVLTVKGDNSALLIGKHGRTLEALQYLVQKGVQKKQRTKTRITVDVEGYRERRKASLTQLARRLGEKVKRSGKPATINPMNAYDRRIVHVALKDDARLRTQSMGAGTLRKLVIYPQKKRAREAEGAESKA